MSLKEKYHLIGIGGIGMSAIAKLLMRDHKEVSGSDIKESPMINELKRLGADIFVGHDSSNIKDVDTVIYSSAIQDDNPEIRETKRRNIPLLKRAQALAKLMQDKTIITVTGSHGKTTTASLISHLLIEAKLFPTMAVGGILRNIDTNAYLGRGEFFVAEADESDGSFLYYQPKYSIITNIDYEHLDYYKSFERAIDAFREFTTKTKAGGCLFCCGDDPNLKKIADQHNGNSILFGLREGLDIYPKNIILKGLSSEFDCFYRDKFLSHFSLSLGGEHNISNALGVIALGLELGIDLKIIKEALLTYKGSGRRLEIKYKDDQYLFIDDYAHHPTEIKATLSALKSLKAKRIITIFQPHRYTRTKLLFNDFVGSFDVSDYIVLTDIYSANELPLSGVSAEDMSRQIKEHAPSKQVYFLPKHKIVEHILEIIQPGDLIITLGAGDIVKVCDELVEKIKR